MPHGKPEPAPNSVRFPVLKTLEVDGYDLFPGKQGHGGLKAEFPPGLTVVLGANGLGKTTLVWIMYRLLSGPSDIPRIEDGGDLGGRSLEAHLLRDGQRRLFAKRVVDEATGATARLGFTLGTHAISVARRLSDLELLEFTVDGKVCPKAEVESYQAAIAEMAGVWSFGDWILLLRHLTFYFEDRRELVWDASAQRHILRLLFLPTMVAKEWTERERQIFELDSRSRNLNAALTREERALGEDLDRQDPALDVREELKSLTAIQDTDQRRRDELDDTLLSLDHLRKSARLTLLLAEQEREALFRALEHAKLVALAERFPSATETARYILTQLLTDSRCLTCGHDVPKFAKQLQSRLSDSKCVICGSAIPLGAPNERKGHLARSKIPDDDGLEHAENVVRTASAKLEKATADHAAVARSIEELDANIAQRRERINTLVRRLPKDEKDVHEQRDELARLRSRVEALKKEVTAKRDAFANFVERVRNTLVARAPRIKATFDDYAREFLIEKCSLSWSPRKERIGQEGIAIDMPAFELDLTSACFRSPVRRTGPDQVSESQREFIDLAFRMALMAVADPDHGGTLVIDAPESSLDAVFVGRAADVLVRFSSTGKNRLIVTSNLTDGKLVPQLLKQRTGSAWQRRIVDLFEIAEPTAAVRELKKEYVAIKKRVLAASPLRKKRR